MADLLGFNFRPPHTWMRLVCGSRTSNCRNLLIIGPNDLIFLLKDRQLNLQKEIVAIDFLHDQPFMRYLQLKLPLLQIVLSWTNFVKKNFQN